MNMNLNHNKNLKKIFDQLIQNRMIFLSKEIDAEVATEVVATILYLDSLSKDEITFFINSNGGSVPDALLPIYDTMLAIKSPIRTICIGEAFSSAAVLLAAGTPGRRFAFPHAEIMIHTLQISEMSGSQEEINYEVRRTKQLNQILMNLISSHTGQPLKKVKRDCIQEKRFSPSEAIQYGLIDDILTTF